MKESSPSEVHAGAAARVLAYVVDALLLTAFLFVVSMALGAFFGPVVGFRPATGSTGSRVAVDQSRMILAAIGSAAISAAYFIMSWTAQPATPGQRLLGIRVGRAADLRRLTLGQASIRWLLLMGPLNLGALGAALVPGLRAPVTLATLAWTLVLLATTVLSPSRRGLHDRFAGSVVTIPSRLAGPVTAQ